MILAAAAAALLMAGSPAGAAVRAKGPTGFAIATTVTIAAAPAEVYAVLIRPALWWDARHSYSGVAANMTIDPVMGGCFCEAVPAAKGAVEHMRVIQVMPGRLLRLAGGLGPLQGEGVAAALTWELKPVGTGTEVSQTYVAGGYVESGFEPMAPMVDSVMTIQLTRLKNYMERGRAAP